MKHKYFRILLTVLVSMAFMSSQAQTWTEPVEPSNGSDPVSGQLYRVKNVAADMYVGHGQTWFNWNTTACLVENSPITWTMTYDETSDGWTFAGYDDNWPGQFLFISGNGIDGFAMHVDNPTDPHRYFELIKQDNGTYRVRCVASDDTYGWNIDNWMKRFWGCNLNGDTPNAMYAAVNPDDGYSCDWIFINMSTYFLQKDLYNLAVQIENNGYNIDYAKYTRAYNSGDYDQLKAAYDELKPLVDRARAYAILAYGDDGVNAPSDDNPCTRATELIKNNDFSAGNIDGWTCTFKSGENATNVGYQQNTDYSYNGVTISKFIEAWAQSSVRFNPNLSFSAIGDGKLSQVMNALPQGKYTFTCDAISVQQYQSSENPVKGVELFAIGGELEVVQNIATGNGLPEHFEVTFVSTGGNVEIGLRTNNATANWIAADNFTLTYFGGVSGDPAKILLDNYIAEIENKFGDVNETKAEKTKKEAFTAALEAAKNATEDYASYQTAIETAVKALQESIDEYVVLKDEIASIDKQIRMAQKDWQNLASNLSNFASAFQQKYDEGTATSAEIAALPSNAYNMCATYISAALQADPEGCIDKEITLLIKNPSFDTAFSEWTVKDGAPTWGGENVQLPADHIAYPYTVDGLVDGGCAEQWHSTFDIQQTIKNMPAGVFQLSCQAFQRDDESDGIDAVLYAVVGTSEQTVKVMDINADAQDEPLYNYEYGGGHGEAGTHNDDAMNGDGKYTPNGMSSANVYFRAGLYKNYFNIVVGTVSDITIGIRTKSTMDWVLFDDFKLVYKGENVEQYKGMIREKKQQLAKMLEENDVAVTDSIDQLVQDVLAQADDALASNVGKTCTEAIQALLDAADAVTANLALMQAFKEEFEELYYYRYEQEGLDGDIPEIMSEIEDKLDPEGFYKFANNAAVEKARIDMERAYNQYVQECLAGNASEGKPADITYVIYNPNSSSYDLFDEIGAKGWNVPVGTVSHGSPTNNGINEFYQQPFEINQTILGLNPGYYRLHVWGCYRDGYGSRIEKCMNNEEGFIEHDYVKLFAGNNKTNLLPVTECYEQYTELVEEDYYDGVTVGNSSKITLKDEGNRVVYIPNGIAAANTILGFEDEEDRLYENILQFEVKPGQGDVTIGLIKKHDDGDSYGDWTVWDNWKLEYIGTEKPVSDPTTGIKGVQISVDDMTIDAAGTATIEVELLNSVYDNLVGFQMDLTLPEGVGIDKTGCSLSSRIIDEDQELTIGKQGENVYRLTSTSFALTPISGKNGALLTLKLTSAANFATGTATIGNIRFSTSESERVVAMDALFDITALYQLTYMVDGEAYRTDTIAYGTAPVPVAAPVKEGHTFAGWSEIPETMPAQNVVVTGTFTVNNYSLIYMVDDDVYKIDSVAYGTVPGSVDAPVKEGHTFAGWVEVPATMPAHDVVVVAAFTVNTYAITYMVDDEVYETDSVTYANRPTPVAAPTKEGYTFGGWSEIPDSMPAHDVVVTGRFYLYGDVNTDEEVDVVDVVDIARFVVATPSEKFMEVLADLNKDNSVNLGDAVTLVNYIAGDVNFVKPMFASNQSAGTDVLSMVKTNSGLALCLDNERSYTAFQFDLYVSENTDIAQMMLNAQRKQKHQLLYNKVEDGHYRVAALSTSNNTFLGNEGELLSLIMNVEPNTEVTLRDIHFFDVEGNDYQFDDISFDTETGIASLQDSDGKAVIYDLQGRRLSKKQRGINIVNGKKIVIK